MRRSWVLLGIVLLALGGIQGCYGEKGDTGDDGVGPPGPKTTIEPDGESFTWTDDDAAAVPGEPSEGKINARFVNRKIDNLRACTTDPECASGSADERNCTDAVLTRETESGEKVEVRMTVKECAGSSGNLCIEWFLKDSDALTERSTSNSRNLPEEFFPDETDKSWALTCDTVPVAYVEIDWKGGA